MQFADPAWEPKVTREFEAVTPSSQAETSPPPGATGQAGADQQTEYENYAHGYRAQHTQTAGGEDSSQSQQQPPSFQPQQSWFTRLPVWAWWLIGIVIVGSIVSSVTSDSGPFGALFSLVVVAFLAFVGWLLYTRRMRISLTGETMPAETHTFTVGAHPTLTVDNKAGSIRLHAGQEGQVSITTIRRGYLFNQQLDKDMQIWYSQDSAANTVSARVDGWRPFGKNTIGFDITVPPQTNLVLTNKAGTIFVENVAGQMTLHSDAGSIQATRVALQGKSRLETDAGTITFSGSLDSAGSYELLTNFGTINASLPADASFDLEARTDVGTVTTNLPIMQPQRSKAYGQIGSGPYPRLKLKTDLGTVRVQRG